MEDKMINYGNRTNMRKRRKRYNMKRIISLLVILFLIVFGVVFFIISLFSDKEEVEPKVDEPVVVEPVVVIKPWEEMTEDQTISKLSGLPVLKSEANKRPVAIIINNAYEALPQSGVLNAEIMYEVPVEGELVRLMGIFQDINRDKIGPVRSARHYFIDYAFDNDAIFVHYGTSPKTDTNISTYNSPSLNGLGTKWSLGTLMFTSDPKRTAPHDKFTSGDGILAGWTKAGYAKMREADKQVSLFKFGASDEMAFDEKAYKVIVNYSYYQKSEFRYDEEEGTYKRFQTVSYNEMSHVDSMGTDDTSDDVQLEYKNVIIQYVKKSNLINKDGSVDKDGRQEIATISSGEGLYITNGTYEPIKWSKTDIYTPTKYTDLAGNEIELNRGKTWICIVPNTIQAEITSVPEVGITTPTGTIDTLPDSVKNLK